MAPGSTPSGRAASRGCRRSSLRLGVVATAHHGGLLHYGAQLADALGARGHDVSLITAPGSEVAGRLQAARLLPVLTRVAPPPGAPPRGLRYVLRRATIAARLLLTEGQLIHHVRRGGYDAVLFVDDLNLALTAAPVLALALIPGGPALAAVCHEPRPRSRSAADRLYLRSPLLTRCLALLYPRLDAVFVHGERSRVAFEERWAPARAVPIPHGDQRLFADEGIGRATEPRVLFFGDWRRAKGLPELLRAFDEVIARLPEARLTIAGVPFPDAEPDRVRAWARGHGDRVTVIDRYVAIEEVPALFGSARLVATPYVAASQSGVVHLAMTLGRPVVSSDAGDLPASVRHGETGLVVPAGDPSALAAALERLLRDETLAERLGEAARRRVRTAHTWEQVAERIEAALEAGVGGPPDSVGRDASTPA